MRPEAAALVVARWSDPLTIKIFWRLSARISAPILAAMDPQAAAKITAGMANGKLKPKPKPAPDADDGAPGGGDGPDPKPKTKTAPPAERTTS